MYDDQSYLAHYGVLGMKWGIRKKVSGYIRTRKANEIAYRKKLRKILKNPSVKGTSDAKRFEWRNRPYSTIIATTAAKKAALPLMAVGVLTVAGRPISKKQMLSLAKNIAFKTAFEIATKDALAKSAANKYQDHGTRKPGKARGLNDLVSKEDLMEAGLHAAVMGAKAGHHYYNVQRKKKFVDAVRRAAEDKRVFDRWGGRLLQEKVDNVIWQSDDLQLAVIDNIRRP